MRQSADDSPPGCGQLHVSTSLPNAWVGQVIRHAPLGSHLARNGQLSAPPTGQSRPGVAQAEPSAGGAVGQVSAELSLASSEVASFPPAPPADAPPVPEASACSEQPGASAKRSVKASDSMRWDIADAQAE